MTNSDNLLHLVSTGQHLVFEKHLPFGIFPPSALFFLSSVQSSPMAASRPNQAIGYDGQRYYCKQKEPEVQNLRQISI